MDLVGELSGYSDQLEEYDNLFVCVEAECFDTDECDGSSFITQSFVPGFPTSSELPRNCVCLKWQGSRRQ